MFPKKLKFVIFFSILAAFFVAGGLVWAQSNFGLDAGNNLNLGATEPRVIVVRIIQIILGFLGLLAVGLIVYGGFVWMTSAGDEKRVETAKKIIISAVIGLVIIFSAFIVATFVINRMANITGAPGGGGGGGGGGVIPSGGGEGSACDENTLTLECDASDSLCSNGYYCRSNNCTCRRLAGAGESCDGDEALASCQASGIMCGANLYCEESSCTCEEGGGVGEPCDLDLEAAGCQVNQNACSRGLTCDSFGASSTCTCLAFPVIEDVSPVGGFCANNVNNFCVTDADCPASTCNTEAPNGASGNIIVISGRYFGTAVGHVRFWNGTDFSVEASFPNNPRCDSNWSDDQIIVVVPAGVQNGPIRIITADAKNEDTNDAVGEILPDFIINDIQRPGLCKIEPESGAFDEEISYYGLNLNNSISEFGRLNAAIAGRNSSFGSINGSALVPNIKTGYTTTFVSTVSGVPSNYLKFSKTVEATNGPRIISFEPVVGAPKQYVTIYGSGFGSTQGASTVYFGNAQTGSEANYFFPDICADSVWSDKQILVKVPESLVNGNYILTVVVNNREVNTENLSPNFFGANSTLSLFPSLCKIKPVLAQVGQVVEFWGEYFGDFDTSLSKVRFYNNRDVFGSGKISFWDEEGRGLAKAFRVKAMVPEGVITGPARIVKNSPEEIGNGLNLEIGSCLKASDPNVVCGAQVCCPTGTYAAGRCVDAASDCAINIPSSVFEWDFSTKFDLGSNDPINQSCSERSKFTNSCPFGTCFNSPGDCSADGASCECCCRKANNNNDCCTGLICEGTCGVDRNNNTNTYGVCSGCRIEIGGVVDQASSDAACNCEGSSYSKYCDVNADPNGDGQPEGACGDCASLDPASCTNHSSTCCVDGTKSNSCAGRQFARGAGNLFDLVTQAGLAYCGYHVCDVNGGCSASNPTAFPGAAKTFKSAADCDVKCAGGTVNLGLSCENKATNACDQSICQNPFACQAGLEGGCGYCCCDPNNDQCSVLNNNLKCQPNVSPCGGADRGLCCGCSSNSECVAGGNSPLGVGCGVDSCCRARPSVITTSPSPADGSDDACTNAAIYVDFNQIMSTASFKGNVLVVGEYSGACPPNSVLLSFGENKNLTIFTKAISFLHNIFGRDAKASPGPNPAMKYCAISGATSAEQVGVDSTRLIFKPVGILDVNVKYFVIIKGDDKLDNSNGVRSSYGVGMYADNSPVDNTATFGSITFTNTVNNIVYHPAFIWSFTTRDNGNKGLCDIEKVDIKPPSYLFNKVENDLNENDTDSGADSFDKTKDADKVFVASAYSSDGQKLYPVTGYAWNWNWAVANGDVAETINPTPFAVNAETQLVRARSDIIDAQTGLTATVNITNRDDSNIGNGLTALADLQVFACTNPWPSDIAADFTWYPWRDNPEGMNCLPATGTCHNTGYKLYYCRDSGETGNTGDDLPAVSAGTTRGSGNGILKESYFFDQN
ncbi:MAG: IPT/TIG domain-containing protein [Patescibacteria group bacterium]|jgi:hypothetical protein